MGGAALLQTQVKPSGSVFGVHASTSPCLQQEKARDVEGNLDVARSKFEPRAEDNFIIVSYLWRKLENTENAAKRAAKRLVLQEWRAAGHETPRYIGDCSKRNVRAAGTDERAQSAGHTKPLNRGFQYIAEVVLVPVHRKWMVLLV